MRQRVSCSFVLAVFVATAAAAQTALPTAVTVPKVVRIDGVLPAGGGVDPSAAQVVHLALYDAPTEGTLLWEETQEIRTDAAGRYIVFLGATTAEGLPVDVLSGGGPRWLSVRFPGAGYDAPRMALTSVPYALKASDAETLGGLPPSAFLRSQKAGDTAPMHADGASPSLQTPGPAANTGTANFIGKFANSIDLTSSVIYEANGRVGVGTGAATPLDIVHSKFTNTDGSLTGIAVQNLGNTATSYSGMLFYDQNGALGQFQGFNNSTHEYRINNIATGGTINFMIGSTSRFRVRNDGDIDFSGNLRRGGVLFAHATGTNNAAFGAAALATIASGSFNTAVGANVLITNNNGNDNTAIGYGALFNATGDNNIAIGSFAGFSVTTGSSNILIGDAGVGAENQTLRIGTVTRAFIGGIRGVTTGASNAVAVVIDGNGQLGTINSSRRYKEDIQDMGDASSALMKLRPVTYRYTQAYADASKPLDYGLIAEEVEQVYPDLVAHLQNGEVETVQYHKINAMLLNEVQKQFRENQTQRAEIDELKARLAALERLLTSGKR